MNEMLKKYLGKEIVSIRGMEEGGIEIIIDFPDCSIRLAHDFECCETVQIEDICGDVDDLIGSPLTMIEEVVEDGDEDDENDHVSERILQDRMLSGDDHIYRWTFYKFATVKGYVTVRWLGTSNGYYSVGVSLYDCPAPPSEQPLYAGRTNWRLVCDETPKEYT